MTEYPRKSINTVTVLDPETRAAVDEWAAKENRSVSNLLDSIVKEALAKRREQEQAEKTPAKPAKRG